MSVLIKGMEMPSRCGECLLAKLSPTGESLICDYMLSRVSWEERPFDCPLVPVPPHGRLIDGDKLAEEQKENVRAYHANLITLDDLAECLLKQSISEDGAPTIIPASEEGE